MRRLLAAGSLLALISAPAAAQSSVFAVRGIGFPGRAFGARSRALGGGFGAVDPLGALNPASIGALTRVTVQASSGTTFRNYDFGGSSVTGLHDTRFPYAMAAGPIPKTRFTMAVSFASYAERTYNLTGTDTVALRGAAVPITDHIASDGGISDMRGALAWRASSHLRLGMGVHLLSGAAKLTASRTFADTNYLSYSEQSEEQLSGVGVSVGAIALIGSTLQLSAAVRSDSHLSVVVDSTEVGRVDLPMHVTGGFLFEPAPELRWATTVAWHGWSRSQAALALSGGNAFDTWEIGSGVELGGGLYEPSRFPIRLGVRYAQLPFSPTADQPHELVFSGGTGLAFAKGRGVFDVALERAIRDGAGVAERAWQWTFGITVRP